MTSEKSWCERFSKWLCKILGYEWVRIILWTILLVAIIFILLCVFALFEWVCLYDVEPNLDFHNGYLIILTALIAVIAWVQLKGLYNNSKADMLLRISQLLRGESALEALTIVRTIRLDIEEEIKKEKNEPVDIIEFRKKHEKEIIEKIGEKIKDLLANKEVEKIETENKKSKMNTETEIRNQVKLINFLNLIEDVCYLCRKKYISSEDIEELLGHELTFYFEIFTPHMVNKRGDGTLYCEFEKVYKKIKCKSC